MSEISRGTRWRVTVYRCDSETPVVYDDVKHTWWEGSRLVVSQYTAPPAAPGTHHYWIWPGARISHVRVEKVSAANAPEAPLEALSRTDAQGEEK